MTDKAMSGADELLSKDILNKELLSIVRYGRFWAVYDNHSGCGCSEQQNVEKQIAGQLVCVTVYRKGAREVVRRLEAAALKTDEEKTDGPCQGYSLAGNGHDE